MAEEQASSLHIDSDWKKQAQEEKKRLTDEAAKRAAPPPPPAAAPAGPPGTAPAPSAGRAAGKGRRELPPATFSTLVQSIVTQILYYLGDLSTGGQEPMVNLDMAKHQIDILGVLEEKTKGNLTPEEQQMLDAALYEVRMRYVNVASQYI